MGNTLIRNSIHKLTMTYDLYAYTKSLTGYDILKYLKIITHAYEAPTPTHPLFYCTFYIYPHTSNVIQMCCECFTCEDIWQIFFKNWIGWITRMYRVYVNFYTLEAITDSLIYEMINTVEQMKIPNVFVKSYTYILLLTPPESTSMYWFEFLYS